MMNAESYFSQYKQLNFNAVDYTVLETDKPYLDIAQELSLSRLIEEYEKNNEEMPLKDEYVVLVSATSIPLGIGKIKRVEVKALEVVINLEIVFV